MRITAAFPAITMYRSGCRASTRLVRVVICGTVSLLVNRLGGWLRSGLLVVLASNLLSLYPAAIIHNDIPSYTSTFAVLWDGLVVITLLGILGDDVPRMNKAGNVAQRAQENVDETVR